MNYFGTIIEESLQNRDALRLVKIISTEVEAVTLEHRTPWLKQWTLHKVEISEENAEKVAKIISMNIDENHTGSWYADYKNDLWHYIIFPHKIFKINKKSTRQYDLAKKYGISLGIPEHQVDFKAELT